jgi:hypothetical protein
MCVLWRLVSCGAWKGYHYHTGMAFASGISFAWIECEVGVEDVTVFLQLCSEFFMRRATL